MCMRVPGRVQTVIPEILCARVSFDADHRTPKLVPKIIARTFEAIVTSKLSLIHDAG